MQTNETKKAGASSFLGRMVRKQVMIPLAALLLLFLFNLIVDPSFFKIELGYNSAGNPVLSGFLITILDSGSELAILAIGMTLVTAATGGQDISVGATTAIAGSVLLRVLCGTNSRPETLQAPIIVAFLVACVVAMLFGAFNGVLVAVFKIQPMIATLILYTAGRSIAAWINNNELPVVSDETLTYFGEFIPGIPIPTPFFIAVACMIVIGLVLKFTNLRLYTQAVGINENSSKLNGLNPVFIKILSFVILGLCVAVVGLIKVARISTINYSVRDGRHPGGGPGRQRLERRQVQHDGFYHRSLRDPVPDDHPLQVPGAFRRASGLQGHRGYRAGYRQRAGSKREIQRFHGKA